jgi:alkylation response protein AidB-like acyl-CoA dehydrogenase
MDFSHNEEHEAVRQLAGQILSERSTHEHLKAIEAAAGESGPFDAELWKQLAEAGLLGIGLPEDVGGAGLDFVAVCLVVEAAGRTAAYVPVVEGLVMGGATIDGFGTAGQRTSFLPPLVTGDLVVTAALSELVGDMVLAGGTSPATTATRSGNGWLLEGTKACVPAGLRADLLLVPATRHDANGAEAGVGVFLVEAGAPGVTRIRQDGAARPEALIELRGVEVGDDALLGGDSADGPAIIAFLHDHVTAALCVQEAGVISTAIELMAEYTKTREQFEKPIATFQAVGQRAADAYVDAEAIRLTAWQAAWRLSEGLPATQEVAIAKFWAADGGQRAVHGAMHLHGGVGVDRDYPLHRYFLLTRQIELTMGGASENLRNLGRVLADEPV